MLLTKDYDVVQAFAANGPNQSFGKAILPRRPRRDGFVPNAHRTEAMPYQWAKDAVPVADQVPWCGIPRESLCDLAYNPFRRRAGGHADPDDVSTL